jgi:hypothetical protein
MTAADGEVSAVSPSRSFTIRKEEPVLRTIFPPDNYAMTGARLPDTRFTWKTNLSGPLRFQISDTPDFSRPVIDEIAAGEAFQGRPLGDGRWYWRIVSGEGNLRTPERSFQVLPAMLQPPNLTSPTQRVLIRPGAATAFAWQPVEGANSYTFSLYSGNSADGKAVYSVPGIARNGIEIPLEKYPEGPYTWTVQAFANESAAGSRRSSPVSSARFDLRQFHPVRLDYPPPGTQYSGLNAQRRPDRVRWSPPENAVNVRFILSRNPDPLRGAPLMDIRNPPASIPLIQLPAGTYYWTIQAETRDGLNIGAPTPSSFQVLPISRLPAARLRRPENGYRLGPAQLRESQSITFAWDAVPGANTYILALYREEGGSRRLIRRWEPSARTSQTLDDLSLLENGSFIWQVEAINRAADGTIEQQGTPGENRFSLNLPPLQRNSAKDPGRVYGQ